MGAGGTSYRGTCSITSCCSYGDLVSVVVVGVCVDHLVQEAVVVGTPP